MMFIDTANKFTIPLGATSIPIYKIIEFLENGSAKLLYYNPEPHSAHSLSKVISITIISFILSWLTALISNLIIYTKYDTKQNAVFQMSLKRIADPLTLMMYDSARFAKLVLFTLDTRKVYVGYVISIDIPDADSAITGKNVEILPLLSGFRNPTALDLVFNTYYDASKFNVSEESLRVSINLDKLVSASYFDLRIHNHIKHT